MTDEFLEMAYEEFGAVRFGSFNAIEDGHLIALCKKVQNMQSEKDVKDHQALCDAMIESIHKNLSSNQIGIQSVESLKMQIGFALMYEKAINSVKGE
jgi:hypothetical protein